VTEQLPNVVLVTVLSAVVVSETPGVIRQFPPEELLAENLKAPLPVPPATVKVIGAFTAALVNSLVIIKSDWLAAVKDNDTAAAVVGP
jgi:hypothetical protein